MSSKLLTDEQIAWVNKARLLVEIYKNPKTGEVSCSNCAMRYLNELLKVIDDLDFELDQLNK